MLEAFRENGLHVAADDADALKSGLLKRLGVQINIRIFPHKPQVLPRCLESKFETSHLGINKNAN